MFQNKTVRSALMLVAISGMLAACSSNSGSGDQAPLAPAVANAPVEVQTASVKIASVTDADGHAVAMDTSAVLTQLATVDRAIVSQLGETMMIDLGNEAGAVVNFNAALDYSNVTVATEGFPITAASVTTTEDHTRIAEMALTVEDGRSLNVLLQFIQPAGDDSKQDAKQDEPKQDEQKKDEPKQDQAKKEEPKQDQPKQDQPKQDQPKQDQPKQDQPKQDQPKKDQPKQDQPKQDQPKKEEPKQDQPKQDQPKQDQPKQDQKKG